MSVLRFTFLDNKREDQRFWTKLYQTFPEFNLLLIFWCRKLSFFGIVPQ